MNKYHWNEKHQQWERIDREQEYRGIRIISITYHWETLDPLNIRNHRMYRLIWPDGHESEFGINKRGGNIKDIKEWLDFKARHNEL